MSSHCEETPSTREDDFVQLLSRHRSQLFGFILTIVQHLDDAEEIFQQTSVVLWEKFDQFEPGTNFMAWACSIARFKVIQYRQSVQRDRQVFSESFIAELAARQGDRSEKNARQQQALAKCRQKLRPKDAHLLGQCYRNDHTIKQVAGQIGRPVSSVYDSLARIRRALYECVRRVLAEENLA